MDILWKSINLIKFVVQHPILSIIVATLALYLIRKIFANFDFFIDKIGIYIFKSSKFIWQKIWDFSKSLFKSNEEISNN